MLHGGEAVKETPKKETAKVATKEKVEEVINQIRPALVADGGNVELISVSDGTVKVKLTGACGSCPMSTLTLKMGIERLLKEKVPGVKEVVTG
jgi:Fe-S cluster biogenesis protein NfuA